MRILLLSLTQRSAEPLVQVFCQSGIYVDFCKTEEEFWHLNNLTDYVAAVIWGDSDYSEIEKLYNKWRSISSLPFIVLSTGQSGLTRARMLAAGVTHYHIEPFSYTGLVREVTALDYQVKVNQPSYFSTHSFEMDFAARFVSFKGELIYLTRKEFDLLSLFLRRKGRVLSRVQIWEEVWGYDDYPLANTIDVHVTRLRKKLPQSAAQLITTVYGVGYQMHELA